MWLGDEVGRVSERREVAVGETKEVGRKGGREELKLEADSGAISVGKEDERGEMRSFFAAAAGRQLGRGEHRGSDAKMKLMNLHLYNEKKGRVVFLDAFSPSLSDPSLLGPSKTSYPTKLLLTIGLAASRTSLRFSASY